ncbi:MAG: hypothetical protein K9H84_06425 [Bacteroidales bacterium]|nr:hypothetical protein [Bacteroidales bacterium]
MNERIQKEIELLKKYFPDLKIDENQKWILLPNYQLPEGMGWNKDSMDICVEFRKGYPGIPPYGIYVSADLRYNGEPPKNWQPKAKNQPSFPGDWAIISWAPDGKWEPKSDVVKGSNMLNFVLSFKERFKEGQ